ncbi:hypothetical protein [Microvirga puerhi]|uniref:GYD domain-containing protein n=1 Tax=Microvirga puerhi TaxID=2876078 RepID=A0ABS7VM16_9HYPH|nr:hypothetical protein [Microvirga puerhi]MBZ6076201.1 hypothetical protein [Microvirga puerhi]
MYNYCLTFRIAEQTVGGKTPSERRQRLIDNVYSTNGFWAEPTSFMLVNSGLSTSELAKKACAGLSASHDLVFVFDPEDMSACYFGPVKEVDVLKSFFPKAKKVE